MSMSQHTLPMMPRPRTVSSVPERLNMRQWRSRSCTVSSPRFSSRMQYRHYSTTCKKTKKIKKS